MIQFSVIFQNKDCFTISLQAEIMSCSSRENWFGCHCSLHIVFFAVVWPLITLSKPRSLCLYETPIRVNSSSSVVKFLCDLCALWGYLWFPDLHKSISEESVAGNPNDGLHMALKFGKNWINKLHRNNEVKTIMNYSGFWKRTGAYLIDVLPIVLLVFLFYYFFMGFDEIISTYINRNPDEIQKRIDFLAQRNRVRDVSFLIWIIYSTVLESSVLQGTVGKKIMGLKVVDIDGNRITLTKSIIRNLSKILSYLPISLGFLWVAFSKEKKGWHDSIAKTYVIKQ